MCIVQYDLLIGSTFTATVSGVTDLAGNPITAPYKWSFVLQDFDAGNSSVKVSGINMGIPYGQFSNGTNTTFLDRVKITLANLLNAPESRFQNVTLAPAPDGFTLASLTIVPPAAAARRDNAGLSATQLALQLAQYLSNPSNDTSDPLLNMFLSSSV